MLYKKFFLAIMLVVLACSCAFGAENEDVYVRKDLFESYMKNVDSKFGQVLERLDKIDKNIETLNQSVADLNMRVTKLETRVDGVYIALSNRIEGVEKRFDVLFNLFIAFIGLIGVIFGLPVVQRWWDERRENNHRYLTAEDVEKLIDAKLRGDLPNAV